jgi:GT2 family glycosyltransferase
MKSLSRSTLEVRQLVIIDISGHREDLYLAAVNMFGEDRVSCYSFRKDPGVSFCRNFGADHSSGEYVAFLDDDVVVDNSCLERILRALRRVPKATAAQPKLLRKGTRVLDGTGDFPNKFWFFYSRGNGEKDLGQYDVLTPIFSPRSACLVIRRDTFNRAGRFDETLMQCEDIDLGWRLWRSGHGVLYVPDSVAYHRGGISRPSNRTADQWAVAVRCALYVFLKNASARQILILFPMLVLLIAAGMFQPGRSAPLLSVARAVLWTHSHLKHIVTRRVQESRLAQRGPLTHQLLSTNIARSWPSPFTALASERT